MGRIWGKLLLAVAGAGYGMLAAAGVLAVLVAVGLIPRFAGATHTGKHILLYEEMVVAGTIFGGILSIFDSTSLVARWAGVFGRIVDGFFLGIFGFFAGMFVGCLALAIAEMLDSIPVFTRRVSLRHGIGIAILAMAAGKVLGGFFYFGKGLHG